MQTREFEIGNTFGDLSPIMTSKNPLLGFIGEQKCIFE